MDTEPFCRALAEATAALEDAAGLAGELQDPARSDAKRRAMAAEAIRLARRGADIVEAAGASLATNRPDADFCSIPRRFDWTSAHGGAAMGS